MKQWIKLFEHDAFRIRGDYHVDAKRLNNPHVVLLTEFRIPSENRGKGLGRKYYEEWEESLPSDIHLVLLQAEDIGSGDPTGFWLEMGFDFKWTGGDNGDPVYLDDEGYLAMPDNDMWKGVNGHDTPDTLEWIYEDELDESLRNPPEIKAFRTTFDDPKINKHVQGQAARKNPKWKKSLNAAMANYGFALVGSGINGAVYQNPKHSYVLKVYRTDAGFEEWVYFARTHPNNKFVPKFGNTIRLNAIFSAIRVEALFDCDTYRSIKFTEHLENVWDSLYPIWPINTNKPIVSLDEEDPDLIELAKFMKNWEVVTDLNPSNYMCRKNGEIVVIDPLYIDPDNPPEW